VGNFHALFQCRGVPRRFIYFTIRHGMRRKVYIDLCTINYCDIIMTKGTHGSISKAGKIRSRSPIIWDRSTRRKTREGNMQKHIKKHLIARRRNKRNYRIRVVIPKLIRQGRIKENPDLKKRRKRYGNF